MKTSVILIILLLFNTTAIIAEPVAQFLKGINSWLFIATEALLLIGYYTNNIIKEVREATQIDFNDLNLFVTKSNTKENP